eukprot:TRINITY_DN14838_c0_g1_i1.p1 TRINITY_DN14838_c0_g1~~TRINITY_DN14838_c0_g1_i1.p1  ORF type:complete len:184 (+),score=37.35 TRINITY_DN14838_c0_g1_i1:28-579(+)
MAGLVKLSKLTPAASKAAFSTMTARMGASPAPWNYLWKPGPYPETEDERVQAAKKYGLCIEDYKPYPKGSDVMAGDYPDMTLVPEAHRDPFYAWDCPEYRRDYGEPLHESFDMYRETRYTPPKNDAFTWGQRVQTMFMLFGTFLGLILICEDNTWIPKIQQPVSAIQTPKAGDVHYTFEPADK